MDSLTSGSSNLDIDPSRLSATEKADLQQFVMGETQKANLQSSIHKLTDVCFKKCITSRIGQGALDRYEEPCVRQCVDRYMDAQISVVRHLETLRGR